MKTHLPDLPYRLSVNIMHGAPISVVGWQDICQDPGRLFKLIHNAFRRRNKFPYRTDMPLKRKNKNVKSAKQTDSWNPGIVSVSPDAFGPVVPNVIGGQLYPGEQNSHRRNSGNGSGKKSIKGSGKGRNDIHHSLPRSFWASVTNLIMLRSR
jgi:hypothetical protein